MVGSDDACFDGNEDGFDFDGNEDGNFFDDLDDTLDDDGGFVVTSFLNEDIVE